MFKLEFIAPSSHNILCAHHGNCFAKVLMGKLHKHTVLSCVI